MVTPQHGFGQSGRAFSSLGGKNPENLRKKQNKKRCLPSTVVPALILNTWYMTRATIDVYLFLAEMVSEWRGSLTQNRRKKNK